MHPHIEDITPLPEGTLAEARTRSTRRFARPIAVAVTISAVVGGAWFLHSKQETPTATGRWVLSQAGYTTWGAAHPGRRSRLDTTGAALVTYQTSREDTARLLAGYLPRQGHLSQDQSRGADVIGQRAEAVVTAGGCELALSAQTRSTPTTARALVPGAPTAVMRTGGTVTVHSQDNTAFAVVADSGREVDVDASCGVTPSLRAMAEHVLYTFPAWATLATS